MKKALRSFVSEKFHQLSFRCTSIKIGYVCLNRNQKAKYICRRLLSPIEHSSGNLQLDSILRLPSWNLDGLPWNVDGIEKAVLLKGNPFQRRGKSILTNIFSKIYCSCSGFVSFTSLTSCNRHYSSFFTILISVLAITFIFWKLFQTAKCIWGKCIHHGGYP